MRNLVIVPAGDASLHGSYAQGRDFELWAIYWGQNRELCNYYKENTDKVYSLSGLKWELIRSLCDKKVDFENYDFIFCPDDDIFFEGGATDVSRLFHTAANVRADVFQPAISNEHYSVGWAVTRHIVGLNCHATNIVESMMPGFSGKMFSKCVLPILHALPHIRAGWGIEATIMRLGEATLRRPVRTFVIDSITAIHTRPVGSGPSSHAVGMDEAFMSPNLHAFPATELARFNVEADAASFEFQFSTPRSEALEDSVKKVRIARSFLVRRNRRRAKINDLLERLGLKRLAVDLTERVGLR